MVPGGPRPRNCRVGHAHGRRVSPWCLEIQVERFIGAAPIAAECNFQELQALARLFCVFPWLPATDNQIESIRILSICQSKLFPIHYSVPAGQPDPQEPCT